MCSWLKGYNIKGKGRKAKLFSFSRKFCSLFSITRLKAKETQVGVRRLIALRRHQDNNDQVLCRTVQAVESRSIYDNIPIEYIMSVATNNSYPCVLQDFRPSLLMSLKEVAVTPSSRGYNTVSALKAKQLHLMRSTEELCRNSRLISVAFIEICTRQLRKCTNQLGGM